MSGTRYKKGDIVLIDYWYNGMPTPVKIIGVSENGEYKVSHNIKISKIYNAPDETIMEKHIVGKINRPGI